MKFPNIDVTRKLQLQDIIDGNQAGRQVLEYPLNNREYPARIIFKVIPNISTGVANVANGKKCIVYASIFFQCRLFGEYAM